LEIDELEESLELRVFMKKLFAELTWCFLRTPSYEISVLLFFSDFKEVLLEMVENSELGMKVNLYRAFFKNLLAFNRKLACNQNEKFYGFGVALFDQFQRYKFAFSPTDQQLATLETDQAAAQNPGGAQDSILNELELAPSQPQPAPT
jgi:hypothetical protein